MTGIEQQDLDEALTDLKVIRGALLVVSLADTENAGDYFGLSGQMHTMAKIVKEELTNLDNTIKLLQEFAPKDQAGEGCRHG